MSFTYSAGVITQANESGKTITAVSSTTGGITVSVTAHGYSNGDFVLITGTTDYNGAWFVSNVSANAFDIVDQYFITGTALAYTQTRTGTVARGDKDLSGISGLTGVTTDSDRPATQYNIGTNRLVINGALAWGATTPEQIVYRGDTLHNSNNITNNGFLLMGGHTYGNTPKETYNYYEALLVENNVYGATINEQNDQTPWTDTTGAGNTGGKSTFWTSSTGTMWARYGHISICGAFTSHTSAVVRLYKMRIQAQQQYVYSTSLYVEDCELGGSASNIAGNGNVALVTNPLLWKNVGGPMCYTAYLALSSATPTGSNIPLEDVPALGSGVYLIRLGATDGARSVVDCFDNADGSDVTFEDDLVRGYEVNMKTRFYLEAKDTSGSSLSAKTYYIGKAGTNQTISYTGTSSLQTFTMRYHLKPEGSTATTTRYDKNEDGTDLLDFMSIVYGYLLDIDSNKAAKGLGTKTFSKTYIRDITVSQTSKATVDAYTGYETPQKAYDGAFALLFDNFDGETELYIGRSGNQLDFGGGSATAIVYNSAAVSKISYSSGTLTFDHAADYTGGCTGTGTFTISGALGLDGGTFDNSGGVVYGSSKTTITDITVTNGMDFTTAGTYTIDGCTIDEVTNSSGGAVTLNVINGGSITTNTGPNITINYPVTIELDVSDINGVSISGARVYIKANGGGPETEGTVIVNDLTNGSGISSTTYNYIGDQPIVGWVRRATSGTLYQQAAIAGTITDNGYMASPVLIEDE